jgi:hypothetical protein
MEWLEFEGELGRVGGSIETKLVGDLEGGFWTGYDEKSVGRVVGMTGGVGCDGWTGNVHLDCVPIEVPNLDKVVLVHPGLQATKEEGSILWEVVVCDFDTRASGR